MNTNHSFSGFHARENSVLNGNIVCEEFVYNRKRRPPYLVLNLIAIRLAHFYACVSGAWSQVPHPLTGLTSLRGALKTEEDFPLMQYLSVQSNGRKIFF